MANICSNYLEITGDVKALKRLLDRIKKQNKTLLEIFPDFVDEGYGGETNYDFNGKLITISFTSKWDFPSKEFGRLAQTYQTLIFKGRYEEPGLQNFGEIHAQGGCISINSMDEHTYYVKHYKEVRDELNRIKTLPYKKFLKEYKDFDPNDEPRMSTLEIDILKRVKDKDLPMFINHTWYEHEAETLYTERLKGKTQ